VDWPHIKEELPSKAALRLQKERKAKEQLAEKHINKLGKGAETYCQRQEKREGTGI
jgi:hypothetical protein